MMEYFQNLFEYHTVNIEYFRITFSLVLLLKFITETQRGYFRYFNDGMYLRVLYEVGGKKIITNYCYKFFYALKIIATVFLLFGFLPYFSLVVIICSLFIEKEIFFKFHTNFFILILVSLFIQKDLGNFATALDQEHSMAEWQIILTISVMYMATAIKKINREFLSGQVIYYTFKGLLLQHQNRFHEDLIGSKVLLKKFPRRNSIVWLLIPLVTILVEILLSILIWSNNSYSLVLSLGLILHISFLVISYRTLLHFSLACISCYLLIIPIPAFWIFHQLVLNSLAAITR